MPTPEQPSDRPITETKPHAFPATVADETHKVRVEKSESGSLLVSVTQGEHVIFAASVSDKLAINLALSDGRQVIFPAPGNTNTGEYAIPPEPTKQPEYPP